MTAQKYYKPFTARTIGVCCIIEANAHIGVGKLHGLVTGITKQDLSNVCLRARDDGLLTAVKGEGLEYNHNKYSVTKNWRSIVENRKRPDKPPRVIERSRRAKQYTAPVNALLVDICEEIEECKGGTCSEINAILPDVDSEKISYWCQHGVRQKLLVAGKNSGRGAFYTVTKDWRKIVESRDKSYKLPEPPPTQWTGISSIFQFAERCCNSVTPL